MGLRFALLASLAWHLHIICNKTRHPRPMATASDSSLPTAALSAPETAPTETPPADAQGALAAKQEPEAPKVADRVILGPDAYVEKFTDEKFTLRQQVLKSRSLSLSIKFFSNRILSV